MQNLAKKRLGITSLIVVVGLALLLVGIISGVTVLSVREQRQSTDTDQSNRAIQAAESSAREVAQQLTRNPDYEEKNCTQPAFASPPGTDIAIVCRRVVSVTSDPIESYLNNRDSSTEVLTAADPVTQMDISWAKAGQFGVTTALSSLYPAITGGASYNRPAMIELTVFSWPRGTADAGFLNSAQQSGIKTNTIVLVPNGSADNSGYRPSSTCGAPSPYSCSARINFDSIIANSANYSMAVRVTARYAPTTVLMQYYKNGFGAKAEVRNSKAMIDVTARSGNLYRRIVAEKPIGELGYVNSVLGSATDICKALVVVTQPSRSLQSNNTCSAGSTSY